MPTSAAEGEGEGFNLNLPLPHGTDFAAWSAALEIGCAAVADFGPDGAGGVARGRHLPRRPDQPVPARHAGLSGDRARGSPALGLPTLFVMEGGYAVEAIGVNAVGVLEGFERG